MKAHELPDWRRFDSLRSVCALATVLGGAALDLVAKRAVQVDMDPPFERIECGPAEAPVATEEELYG